MGKVTVKARSVFSVDFNRDVSIEVGETFQFVAICKDKNGVVLVGKTPENWKVGDPSICSVTPSGFATGINVGSTTTVAVVDGKDYP